MPRSTDTEGKNPKGKTSHQANGTIINFTTVGCMFVVYLVVNWYLAKL
jgi:hypothetical protein